MGTRIFQVLSVHPPVPILRQAPESLNLPLGIQHVDIARYIVSPSMANSAFSPHASINAALAELTVEIRRLSDRLDQQGILQATPLSRLYYKLYCKLQRSYPPLHHLLRYHHQQLRNHVLDHHHRSSLRSRYPHPFLLDPILHDHRASKLLKRWNASRSTSHCGMSSRLRQKLRAQKMPRSQNPSFEKCIAWSPTFGWYPPAMRNPMHGIRPCSTTGKNSSQLYRIRV